LVALPATSGYECYTLCDPRTCGGGVNRHKCGFIFFNLHKSVSKKAETR
jgi:hypothetical protein